MTERECAAAAVDQQAVRVNYLSPRQTKLQTLYLNAMDFHPTPIFPIAALPLCHSTSFSSRQSGAISATSFPLEEFSSVSLRETLIVFFYGTSSSLLHGT